MGFIPDSDQKTVVIPVEIRNGAINYLFDGPLPRIAEKTVCQLIVPESAIEDKDTIRFLSEERHIEIFPAGTPLYVELKPHKVPDRLFLTLPIKEYEKRHKCKYVEIIILEPLYLVLRGAKHPRLENARCTVPILNAEASSLNHAYTMLSQEFEKNRISHVSNVFSTIYFKHPYRIGYHPLNYIRNDRDLLFDRTLKKYNFKKDGGI